MADRPARHVVLTIKHSDDPLRAQFDRLVSCFAKLRRQPVWAKAITGGAYFFEVKRSADGRYYHPHLHVICVGGWVDREELSSAWLKVTGDSHVVWISLVTGKEKVVNYAAKYASKPFDPSIIRDHNSLVDAIGALRGRRLCSTFGAWRGVGLEDDNTDTGVWVHLGFLNHIIRDAKNGCLASGAVIQRLYSRPKAVLTIDPGPE